LAGGEGSVKLKRKAGRIVAPHVDDLASDIHRLTEAFGIMIGMLTDEPLPVDGPRYARLLFLRQYLRDRFKRQGEELEDGPPPI
jgi:hypothetical protein